MNTITRTVRRLVHWVGIAALLLTNIATGAAPSSAPRAIVVQGDPHTPLAVTLTVDQLPRVGESLRATVEVVSRGVDAPGTLVQLVVPANMAVTSDAGQWTVDLKADQPASFQADLKLIGRGNAVLRANARYHFDKDNIFADEAVLYFHADDDASTLDWLRSETPAEAVPVDTPLAPELGVAEIQAVAYALNEAPSIGAPAAPKDNSLPAQAREPIGPTPDQSAAEAPNGNLTITGHWYYDDRAGVQQPIKALIEILDAGNAHLAWTYSNWDGSFSVTIPNPGQFKVRLYAYYNHVGMSVSAIRIVPDGSFNAGEEFDTSEAYKATTGLFGPYADGTQNVGGWKPGSTWDGRFAWWIYADMLAAYFQPWYCTPYCGADGAWLPDGATAEWSFTSTDGDYFDYSKINLEGTTRNSASTIIHEYGHAIMQNVYGGSAYFPTNDCPSPHYIQYIGNWNCAWTEGWANYFSMAVRGENFYRWASGSTLNLETPSWTSINWDDGEKVEGRLAGWLWDMTDHADDGLDVWDAPNGFAEIWDVFYNQNDNTVAQFYSAWVSRGHSKHHALFEAYQNTIDYDSAPTISGIPNIVRPTGAANNIIDLWVYADDADSSDSQLTYTIQSVSNPNVGVVIDGLDFIDLHPTPNWCGTATVVVKVSDGAKSDTDTFTITLNQCKVYTPLMRR